MREKLVKLVEILFSLGAFILGMYIFENRNIEEFYAYVLLLNLFVLTGIANKVHTIMEIVKGVANDSQEHRDL